MHPVDELYKLGYSIQSFSQWHHRVEGVFDFWINKRDPSNRWHDIVTGERGIKPQGQLVHFIKQRLGVPGATEVPQQEFVRRLVEIGWTEEEATKSWNERKSKVMS